MDTPTVKVLSRNPIQFAGTATGLEKFFKLEHWRVQVDEREDDRIIWKRGDFILVAAVTVDGEIVLIREYKQAAEQTFLCLPAGTVKKEETPEKAALRELREESGYIGDLQNCRVVGPFFNSPDKSTERHFVVLVSNAVREGEPAPEASETLLGVQLLPLEDAKEKMIIGLHRMAVDVVQDLVWKK